MYKTPKLIRDKSQEWNKLSNLIPEILEHDALGEWRECSGENAGNFNI